ncbi:MAG: hypothetical protein ACRD19_14430 [Terriglobia bacterium]
MNPREKIWGLLVSLRPEGVTLRGINVELFDDFVRQALHQVEMQITMMTAFYPMHRVERIAYDEPCAGIPSLADTFREKVGVWVYEYLREEKPQAAE